MKPGFRKTSKPVAPERVDYDHLEKKRKSPKSSSKTSRRTSPTADDSSRKSSGLKRPRPSTSEQQSTTRSTPSLNKTSTKRTPSSTKAKGSRPSKGGKNEDKKMKAHYPKISFNAEEAAQLLSESTVSSGRSHKKRRTSKSRDPVSHGEIAVDLVRAVCTRERRGLSAFFKTEKCAGRDAVLGPMLSVLDNLPSAVEEGIHGEEKALEFHPEVPAREAVKQKSAAKTLEVKLQDQLRVLRKYTDNLEAMEEELGVAVTGATLQDLENSQHTDTKTEDMPESSQFDGCVDNMGNLIDTILSGLESFTESISTAKASQEKLYGAFSKARFATSNTGSSGSTSTVVPKDTRDIIKGLQKM